VGAVGSLVGQLGKIHGCRVVGIAKTDEKCCWIREDLGFDAAVNYKADSVSRSLKRHCPDGIDIYFENVGGKILDTVLGQINVGARIPLCRLISQYNATGPGTGPYRFANLITKRATIQGFVVFDYADRSDVARAALREWLVEGKLKYRVDVVEGLANAPLAINKLFDGSNRGKLIIRISQEP
jgi:NADPH-dependent curcumin reductase CurA